ncbi:MAG: hypothetical protein M3Y77_03815 [Actinomycetota bacterium]|nr:hypothetical protein [Actinomycetota bacterium]
MALPDDPDVPGPAEVGGGEGAADVLGGDWSDDGAVSDDDWSDDGAVSDDGAEPDDVPAAEPVSEAPVLIAAFGTAVPICAVPDTADAQPASSIPAAVTAATAIAGRRDLVTFRMLTALFDSWRSTVVRRLWCCGAAQVDSGATCAAIDLLTSSSLVAKYASAHRRTAPAQ